MLYRVLFVCLGNICRSPLAQAAFEHAATQAGLDVEVDSAGTRGWHEGKAPDKRSISVARQNGIDISAQRARVLTKSDFAQFDQVIAMDTNNLAAIHKLAPLGHRARVALLLDHVAGQEGQGVDDPWHGRAAAFERTWEEVSLGARGLVTFLQSR